MSQLPKPQGVLWVCVDCMLAREHAELPPDDFRCCNGEYEPWSQEPDLDITFGMAWSDHAEDCHARLSQGEDRDECDCEHDSFSRQACDGCGHPCHGERYAYTWWSA